MKQIHIRLSEEEHRLIRLICIQKGITIQQLGRNLFRDFLNNNKHCLLSITNNEKEK